MKKLLILLLIPLYGYTGAQAQSLDEAKSGSNYYGEANASGEDAAIKSAKSELAAAIKPDMMKNPQYRKADEATCRRIADQSKVVVWGSGSRTIAVAYIPKAELKRVYSEVTMFDELPDDGLDEFGVPVAPGNAPQQQPKQPQCGEVRQDPPVQTPKPEAPRTQSPATQTAQPATNNQPPVVVTAPPASSTAPAARPAKTGNAILDEMIDAINIIELNDLLTIGKNKGSLAYGRLNTMTAPENSYLLVYKPDGTIVAVYDRGSSTRRNLRTGTDENYASAFDNVKIIWFQLY